MSEPQDPIEKARYHLVEGRGHTNLREHVRNALAAYDKMRVRNEVLVNVMDSPSGMSPREIEELYETGEDRAKARVALQDMLTEGRMVVDDATLRVIIPGVHAGERASHAQIQELLNGEDTETIEVTLKLPLVGKMRKGFDLDRIPNVVWQQMGSMLITIKDDDGEPQLVLFYGGGGHHQVKAPDRIK